MMVTEEHLKKTLEIMIAEANAKKKSNKQDATFLNFAWKRLARALELSTGNHKYIQELIDTLNSKYKNLIKKEGSVFAETEKSSCNRYYTIYVQPLRELYANMKTTHQSLQPSLGSALE